jgi:hypothetical protein
MFLYFCFVIYFFAMHSTLLFVHSLVRWLVFVSLFYAILRSWRGYQFNMVFGRTDDLIRHWMATFAQVQMVIGIILYTQSPFVRYFWTNFKDGVRNRDALFFSLVHIVLMFTAVAFITTGSSIAKRTDRDRDKFRIVLIWFFAAFILILAAIPWPFSPLAQRPYLR